MEDGKFPKFKDYLKEVSQDQEQYNEVGEKAMSWLAGGLAKMGLIHGKGASGEKLTGDEAKAFAQYRYWVGKVDQLLSQARDAGVLKYRKDDKSTKTGTVNFSVTPTDPSVVLGFSKDKAGFQATKIKVETEKQMKKYYDYANTLIAKHGKSYGILYKELQKLGVLNQYQINRILNKLGVATPTMPGPTEYDKQIDVLLDKGLSSWHKKMAGYLADGLQSGAIVARDLVWKRMMTDLVPKVIKHGNPRQVITQLRAIA